MTKIHIKGVIIPNDEQWIYDWFGIDAVSPKKVHEQLENATDDLEVEINSGGGSVFDASEIYTALKDYPKNVVVKIVGVAASAASVIAMSGDKVLMSPTAQMMIHNARKRSEGDYRDMDSASNLLKNTNQTIVNAYSMKCGKSYEELLSMMDNETWLTPQQAFEHKLIDEIMFQKPTATVASENMGLLLPQEVIDKVRVEMAEIRRLEPVALHSEPPINKEDDEKMDIEKLKNEHPDLYNQIKNEGHEEGIKAENARIKAIEETAPVGYENLVNQAKFETFATAEQLAVNILKAQREQGQNFLQNRNEDAQELENVEGSFAPENDDNEHAQIKNKGNAIANLINKSRGGK